MLHTSFAALRLRRTQTGLLIWKTINSCTSIERRTLQLLDVYLSLSVCVHAFFIFV